MWLKRTRSIIDPQHAFVHIDASTEWGTHYLIADLVAGRDPVVWIHLDKDDTDVVVSYKLSDAVYRAFRTRLFGYGLPLSYCWLRLADSQKELGKYFIAVTGSPARNIDFSPWIARPATLIVCGSDFSFVDSSRRPDLHVRTGDLSLTLSDAEEIARDRISSPDVKDLYQRSEGRYEVFLGELQRALGLPPLERPYPDGFRPIDGENIPPSPLIDSHIRRGYWLEAFEVASKHCPERVPELLENAAGQYEDRGLMSRLFERLSMLPASVRKHELVVYWLVASAIAVNMHRGVIADVKREVDIASMPDVRALLAVHEPSKNSLTETAAAYKARKTLVTTRLHAFALTQFGEPERALELLKNALGEAHAQAKWRDQISIASSIAHAIALTGDYTASLTWAEWALKGFENFGVNDEIEKLYVTSQVRYMKLLVGETEDLPEMPTRLEPTDLVGVPTVDAVISTLGDVHFVSGDLTKALKYYRTNQTYQPLDLAGHFVLDVCRALLASGQVEAAIDETEGAVSLAEGTNSLNVLKARLARAIAFEASPLHDGRSELTACLNVSVELRHWDLAAIAAISLASNYLKANSVNAAGDVLLRCERGLVHLGGSGWALFGQWISNLSDVERLWSDTQNPAELRVLGEPRLRMGEVDVHLSLRNAEILTVMAMHPEGLNGEQLEDKLYATKVSSSTLKASLSRLRSVVPIRSQPYSIDAYLAADFLSVESLLERGKVSEALIEYRGPLLRDSSAPAIVAHREYLEEAVRQAAMRVDDIDSLFNYAQHRLGDLEVWERLRCLMHPEDSRVSFVEARVMRLREEWGITEA